ncbi:TetR family transcriptional regulator|uniref:TetR family transcriptional regulator n=1 Tax=Brenneria salicis ATCC 15712 = DSM 30166 TaxID=714314 RepID=A0A366I4B3_9GAMM|nr:TetR/AcrR family transcriptional regulator [Brenneria salicis]NMN91905.1 TetR family transcriptional regulator [Brenneria salicis ATCC 15712 = DSM 30166]RBP62875.1 TetR family transcriptional regulator [Brenneria salicis ATCC 15712 = DSM 30166]RLM30740.1 hypothetical protein BHG07_09210 [Brenneria salicis ATCC 15712 = DSM 30166]
MSRSKTESVRNAFLTAAIEVFLEVGFEQAAMDAIAARSGRAKSTLYRYFDSKEALFSALIVKASQGHDNEIINFLYRSGNGPQTGNSTENAVDSLIFPSHEADCKHALTQFGQYILTHFHTPQALAVRRMMIAAAATHPEIGRHYYEQGPSRVIKHLEQYFSPLIDMGYFHRADPHVVACHYFGLLVSEINEAGLHNVITKLNDEQSKEIASRSVTVFMRAYVCEFPQ